MDSQQILTTALEAIHRSILKASDTDELPELSLYSPLPRQASTGGGSADEAPGRAALSEITADEADDQKSEPGLQSSIKHGDKKVSTASSARGRSDNAPGQAQQEAAEDWFGDIAWSKDGAKPTSEDEAKSSTSSKKSDSSAPGQSTEEFFTGVDWDADTNDSDSQEPADLDLLGASTKASANDEDSEDDAADFFESTNWDGGSNKESGGKESESKKDDGEQDAESFLGETNWDGSGESVTVDPEGEPPEHVKKLSDADRGESKLPANEDAIGRSEQSKKDEGKE